CFNCPPPHLPLHSFPTRRSSDLAISASSLELSPRPSPSRSLRLARAGLGGRMVEQGAQLADGVRQGFRHGTLREVRQLRRRAARSEEHTSELQSLAYLVCRLLLE